MNEGGMTARVKVLAGVVALLFAALSTRLWFLQVLAADHYRERAQTNRVRLVPIPAPRGQILDRNGNVLVDNRTSFEVTVNRQNVPDEQDLLYGLSGVLGVAPARLAERLEDQTYLPFQPVPIAQDVPEQVAAYLEEQGPGRFPGVGVRVVGVREHAHADLAAHILGYLGEVSPEELEDPFFQDYRPGDEVGRGGVEQHYERFLRGDPGWVSLQVDSGGRIVSPLGRKEPSRGNDLYLSIDLGLQQLAEQSLFRGISAARGVVGSDGRYLKAAAGSVVALDPRTGHVLALVSYPSFDPGIFRDGITNREWRRMNAPSNNFPLSNRAIQGLYPAGSALKPFVAAAALRAGLAAPGGFFSCPPEFRVPGDTSGTVFRNWKSTHSGYISLPQSLAESCDTVFYQFGYQFYREWRADPDRGEMFQRQLRKWGFDDTTGVDVPGEKEGRVPDEAWKQRVNDVAPKLYPEGTWLPGDNVNMSIGQGDLLVTPLQLASAYAALANGGTLFRPEIGLRVEAPDGTVLQAVLPQRIREVPLGDRARELITAGLRQALLTGTAASAFAGFPHSTIPTAGKTGTAEVTGRQSHSWFAAYAPVDDPQIVVVALVEEGGHGSQVAAPIVRRILEGFFGVTPTEFHIGVATD